MSIDKKTLAGKLAEVMRIVAYVQFDGKNTFHKYRYASAAKVYQKVNEALADRNVSVSSSVELLHTGQRESKNGDLSMDAVVKVTLTFVDGDSNETQSVQGMGQGSDKGDKSVMKAVTAATKYALSTGFLISWGDDPEEDIETDRQAYVGLYAKMEESLVAVTTEDSLTSWKEEMRPKIKNLTSAQKTAITKMVETKTKELSK